MNLVLSYCRPLLRMCQPLVFVIANPEVRYAYSLPHLSFRLLLDKHPLVLGNILMKLQ